MPDVAPAFWPIYNDDVTWPSSTIIIPSMLRDQFGDDAIVARHYDSAKKWMDYMLRFVTQRHYFQGQLRRLVRAAGGSEADSFERSQSLNGQSPAGDVIFLLRPPADGTLRDALGKTAGRRRFGKLADDFKTAFNEKFLNRELGQYDNGTQTSCVLPLAFGLVPDDMREKIFDHLVRKITIETQRPHRHRA